MYPCPTNRKGVHKYKMRKHKLLPGVPLPLYLSLAVKKINIQRSQSLSIKKSVSRQTRGQTQVYTTTNKTPDALTLHQYPNYSLRLTPPPPLPVAAVRIDVTDPEEDPTEVARNSEALALVVPGELVDNCTCCFFLPTDLVKSVFDMATTGEKSLRGTLLQ